MQHIVWTQVEMAWKPLCWDYVPSQDGGFLVGWVDECADTGVSAIQRESSRELCSSAVFLLYFSLFDDKGCGLRKRPRAEN
jgi:hypothetical protein